MSGEVRHLNPIKSFSDLDIYQRSYSLALSLHAILANFPKAEQYSLAEQMRRASRSICSNIAEGHAKSTLSAAEFKRFLMIAYGSTEEMRVWLSFSRDLGYMDAALASEYDGKYVEVAKMIYSLHKKWT